MNKRRIALMLACLLATAPMWTVGGDRARRPLALPAPGAPGTTEQAPRDDRAATALAQRSGSRVEVDTRASQNAVVWANPDGSYTSETYARPVRVRGNGGWIPVDTTLVRRKDGSVAPKAAAVPMKFSGGGSSPLATLTRVGRTMGISWPKPLPPPVLHANTATYPGVYPDVDLVVTADVSGFSHVLVVKNAMALAGLNEVVYGVLAERVSLRANADGGLTVVDAGSREAVFVSPPPVMWDSAGRIAKLGMQVSGERIRLTPNRAMLADPGLVFPVSIDPYTHTTALGNYAMVDSGYPDQEYWKWAGSNNSENQRIGQCPRDTSSDCHDSDTKRLYFELPTPYQDDSMIISSAKFSLTLTKLENTWAQRRVQLYRATGRISTATNWRNQPDDNAVLQESKLVDNETFVTKSCTAGGTNITFDAKEAVLDAAVKNEAVKNFMLRAELEDDMRSSKRFCHNAVLAVTYNRPPSVPRDLSANPSGLCTTTGLPVADRLPVLSAKLSDPDTGDAEDLVAEFTVAWTDPAGAAKQKVWKAPAVTNGSIARYDLANPSVGIANVKENSPITWSVRSSDDGGGTSWGQRSEICRFQLDTHGPNGGPHIESAQYMPDNVGRTDSLCLGENGWRDGVGNQGTFTVKAAVGDADVVRYYYGINSNPLPTNVLTPSTTSGAATFSWMPDSEGDYAFSVQSVDVANNLGPITTCHVLVKPGRAPVNEWRFDDAAGATVAVDSRRGMNATAAGSGVRFGEPGRMSGATAAHLGGQPSDYLSTAATDLVNTTKPYTVRVWARLDDLDSDQTVISLDGTGEVAFELKFEKGSGKWRFATADSDGVALQSFQVRSAANAVAGRWTHLLAGYDPVKRQVFLQVDGEAPSVAAHRSSWAGHGRLQFGRKYAKTGYETQLRGSIADVQLYDRIVPPTESTRLAAKRLAYWRLNETGEEHGGTRALTLRGGAAIYHPTLPGPEEPPDPTIEKPLLGTGHLVLGGGEDDAMTASPVIGLSGSFTVSVRVRLAAVCGAAGDQAVLSQPAGTVSRLTLRCAVTAEGPRWQVALANADNTTGGQVVVTDYTHGPDPQDQDGQTLTVTFNHFTGELLLYVDAQLDERAKGTHTATWSGTVDGGLLVGSAIQDAAGRVPSHLSGAVDDVRVYAGVLDQITITKLNSSTEHLEI